MNCLMIAVLIFVSIFTVNSAMTNDRVPNGAKPLSEIVKLLEEQGYDPVEEIAMENGRWEAETLKNGVEQHITVDPVSGKVTLDESESSDKTSK